MRLELLDIFDDYPRVENTWKALSPVCDCSYFLSWGWMENWISSLSRGTTVKLAVLTDGGSPILAFFLGHAKMANQGIFRSKAYLLNQTGDWAYDRLYIEHNSVLHNSQRACSLQQIVDMLPEDWDEFYLSALDPSNFPGNDLGCINPPYELMIANQMSSPYVDLQLVRERAGDYVALLGPNVRSQIRRSYRLYEARGPITQEVARDVATALDIYGELIRLHQAWWQRRNKPGAFASEYFRDFHRRLIEKRLMSGEIQLTRVRCGDFTIGCVYNFVFRGTVYFYQSGLTFEDDNRVKPGYICHSEAIKLNAGSGHLTYDFLAGFDEYKERLSTHQRQIMWVRVQKPRIKFKIERLLRRAALGGAARYRAWKRGKKKVGVRVALGQS